VAKPYRPAKKTVFLADMHSEHTFLDIVNVKEKLHFAGRTAKMWHYPLVLGSTLDMKSSPHRNVLLLIAAVCLGTMPNTIAAENQASAGVKWVNSQLPAGPGLEHHVLHSAALGWDVGYVVWRPANYDPAGKYPVIYFLHGASGTESSDAAGFSGWVAKGIEKGMLPPVLVVFPNGGMSGYRGAVETMIVEELIPLIDRTQPTLAQPQSRAVVGFSMGGAGGVRLSVLHPELFAAAVSMGGRAGGEVDAAAEKNASALNERKVAFLLINGEKDSPKAFQLLVKKFTAAGVEHSFVIHPNLEHNLGLYYEQSFEKLMPFLGAHLKNQPVEGGAKR
jgi:enterochelin esterase-like enzyme